jgi:hypothetical protein
LVGHSKCLRQKSGHMSVVIPDNLCAAR